MYEREYGDVISVLAVVWVRVRVRVRVRVLWSVNMLVVCIVR